MHVKKSNPISKRNYTLDDSHDSLQDYFPQDLCTTTTPPRTPCGSFHQNEPVGLDHGDGDQDKACSFCRHSLCSCNSPELVANIHDFNWSKYFWNDNTDRFLPDLLPQQSSASSSVAVAGSSRVESSETRAQVVTDGEKGIHSSDLAQMSMSLSPSSELQRVLPSTTVPIHEHYDHKMSVTTTANTNPSVSITDFVNAITPRLTSNQKLLLDMVLAKYKKREQLIAKISEIIPDSIAREEITRLTTTPVTLTTATEINKNDQNTNNSNKTKFEWWGLTSPSISSPKQQMNYDHQRLNLLVSDEYDNPDNHDVTQLRREYERNRDQIQEQKHDQVQNRNYGHIGRADHQQHFQDADYVKTTDDLEMSELETDIGILKAGSMTASKSQSMLQSTSLSSSTPGGIPTTTPRASATPATHTILNTPRKRSWSREEHFFFLRGLRHYGKGMKCWKKLQTVLTGRSISQIQSHAKKFFLRGQKKENEKRMRSIHDLDLDSAEMQELSRKFKISDQTASLFSARNPSTDRLLGPLSSRDKTSSLGLASRSRQTTPNMDTPGSTRTRNLDTTYHQNPNPNPNPDTNRDQNHVRENHLDHDLSQLFSFAVKSNAINRDSTLGEHTGVLTTRTKATTATAATAEAGVITGDTYDAGHPEHDHHWRLSNSPAFDPMRYHFGRAIRQRNPFEILVSSSWGQPRFGGASKRGFYSQDETSYGHESGPGIGGDPHRPNSDDDHEDRSKALDWRSAVVGETTATMTKSAKTDHERLEDVLCLTRLFSRLIDDLHRILVLQDSTLE